MEILLVILGMVLVWALEGLGDREKTPRRTKEGGVESGHHGPILHLAQDSSSAFLVVVGVRGVRWSERGVVMMMVFCRAVIVAWVNDGAGLCLGCGVVFCVVVVVIFLVVMAWLGSLKWWSLGMNGGALDWAGPLKTWADV